MSAVFPARYAGPCAADCGARIDPGDDVQYVDDALVHAACSAGMDDEREHRRPERPACPSCWTVHAGECM